jgi:excisionase family DNA binding protein
MSDNHDNSEIFTTSEVAVLLGLHKQTVRKWTETGFLKATRNGPRNDRLFLRGDIDKALIGLGGSVEKPIDLQQTNATPS